MKRSIVLKGWITGGFWMGGKGGTPFNAELERDEPLFDELDRLLKQHGGNFYGSRFTADTYIEITDHEYARSRTGRVTYRQVTRFVELTELPSVSDLVDPETFSDDFLDDD